MTQFSEFPSYFLGANSPGGFFSYLEQLHDCTQKGCRYLIKGGPGCGKSEFLEKILWAATDKGYRPEIIRCVLKPESLDGIYIPELNVSILDSTAPHALDVRFPGVCDSFIDLGQFLDEAKLTNYKLPILELYSSVREQNSRAGRFLSACGSLMNDTTQMVTSHVDFEKLERYAGRVAKKEIRETNSKEGKDHTRFLTAITPDGGVFLEETASLLCDRFYVIDDSYSVISNALLTSLREKFLSADIDTVSCYCCIKPGERLEHLLIPELRLGFLTSNEWHTAIKVTGKRVNAERFIDMKALHQRKNRLSFNRRLTGELFKETIAHLNEAREKRMELETFYRNAMDFSGIQTILESLMEKVFSD